MPPEALGWPPDVSRLPRSPAEPSLAMLLSHAVSWPGGGGAGIGGRPEACPVPEASPPRPAGAHGEAASEGPPARPFAGVASVCCACDASCRVAGGPAWRCRSRRDPCMCTRRAVTLKLALLPAPHDMSTDALTRTPHWHWHHSPHRAGGSKHLREAVLKVSELPLIPLPILLKQECCKKESQR